jgi:hypothetical protein
MKKILLFMLSSLVFVSCSLNPDADKSPQISFYDITINGEAITDQSGILVEDTLRMNVTLQGYYHELTELNIVSEDDFVEFSFDESFTTSDWFSSQITESGVRKYIFKPGIKTCVIPVQVVGIQKKQQSVELSFSLESKSIARGDYNPRKLNFAFTVSDTAEE